MTTIHTAAIPSPLGLLHLAATEEAIVALWLHEQRYAGIGIPRNAEIIADGMDAVAPLRQGRAWLRAYFAGERPEPTALPLAPQGSAFRLLIWELLGQIPYGSVTTYGALAKDAASRLGKPQMAAQAVGGAVGHNPIAILIPCHRVVGVCGDLTGYGGGLVNKIWLLRHEGVDLSGYHLPR